MGRIVKVACARNCFDNCLLNVEVSNGKIVKISPTSEFLTRAIGCPKLGADIRRVYSSKRILYPYIKTVKGFKRIGWEEAISTIISKLDSVLNDPSKILYLEYGGNIGLVTRYFSRRLWHFIRASETDYTICDGGGGEGLRLLYGSVYGWLPKDYSKVKMFVLWGFNIAVSAPHLLHLLLNLRKANDSRIVSIDIRTTETSRLSDEIIVVRPGTDGILALGIANYLVENDMINKEFIEKNVYGFKEFSEHVRKYSLDYVEAKTGVKKNAIEELAESLYEKRPSLMLIGYGLQRRYGGGEIVRSIASLSVLLGIPRGHYYNNRYGLEIDFNHITGADRWKSSRVISMQRVSRMLYKGEFKFVYSHLINPAVTLPNRNMFVKGISENSVFLVTHDTHWTDTAQISTIVLPAPTFYEKPDYIAGYWHNYVFRNLPVIEPLGESLSEFKVMRLLSKELNLPVDVYSNYDDVIKESIGEKAFNELISKGWTMLEYKKIDEFQTPTRKIELVSTYARERALPLLPTPPEGEILEEDEYLLITSAHPLYMHTQNEDVYGSIPPYVYINPEDASREGINEGDTVELFNSLGKIVMKAKFNTSLPLRVLWAPRHALGLNSERISVVMNDDLEELGGGSVLNSSKVRIRLVREE